MENGNVILVVLATAIVAAVGAFCIIDAGSDGGDPLPDIKSDLEPGDFVTSSMHLRGEWIEARVVVVSNLDDDNVGILLYSNGVPDYTEYTVKSITGRLTVNGGGYTDLEELDRVSEMTYMGQRDCVLYSCVYEGMAGEVLADAETGLVYQAELDNRGTVMEIEVLETSMVNVFGPGEVPDVHDAVDYDPEVGDYVQALVEVYEGSSGEGGGMTYTVTSVDKDAGRLTYSDSDGISHDTTVDGFYELFVNVPEEGSYDRVETDLYETLDGDKVCDLYYKGDTLVAAVGSESGLMYYQLSEIGDTAVVVYLFDSTLFW